MSGTVFSDCYVDLFDLQVYPPNSPPSPLKAQKEKSRKRIFCQNELKFSSNFFILLNKSYSMTLKTSGDQGILLE